MSLLILIIFLISLSFSNEGAVELVLTMKIYNKEYYTRMCFGEPMQCFNLFLDFNIPYIWINSEQSNIPAEAKFDPTKSESINYLKEDFSYNDILKIEGTKIKDNIVFPQFSLDQSEILLVSKGTDIKYDKICGKIGFAFPTKNETDLSFVELLKKNKIINEKVFVFQKTTNQANTKIMIGQVPSVINTDYQHFGRCDLTSKKLDDKKEIIKIWDCTLSSVYLGDKKNDSNTFIESNVSPFTFNIQEYYTIVPIAFLLFLERTYFNKLIESGECSVFKEEETNYYSFICLKEKPQLDDLNFELGNWKFSLKSSDLFYQYGNYYKFYMKSMPDQQSWIIGSSLLINFIVLYDMENNFLGLYNETQVSYNTINPNEIPKPDYPTWLPDFENPNKYSTIKKIGITIIILFSIFGMFLLFRFWRRSRLMNSMESTKNDYIKYEE